MSLWGKMILLRRPLLLIPLVLVVLVAVFIVGGYTLLPGLVRSQGQAYVEKNLPGKVLTLGDIAFDPLSLTLSIRDIAIADAKAPQQPLVAVDALTLDASISSLWRAHARLDAVVAANSQVIALGNVMGQDHSRRLADAREHGKQNSAFQ